MNEHNHQKLLIAWFEDRYPDLVLFAIPNGGRRDPATAARLKEEGVRPGVPDLFLAVPRGPVPGLFIEMKAVTRGRLSAAQVAFHAALKAQGYRVDVCRGWEQARDVIVAYLSMPASRATVDDFLELHNANAPGRRMSVSRSAVSTA